MRFLPAVLAATFGLTASAAAHAQQKLPWSPTMQLTLADFRASSTRITPDQTSYFLSHGANVEFSFFMSAYEYMATKNFNSKVLAYFAPELASVAAPDTATAERLVAFERYAFDVAELYARRIRKDISDHKRIGSSFDLANPIFERHHHAMQVEMQRVFAATVGEDNYDLLAEEHAAVLKGIDELPDYCQSCKLPKRKKA